VHWLVTTLVVCGLGIAVLLRLLDGLLWMLRNPLLLMSIQRVAKINGSSIKSSWTLRSSKSTGLCSMFNSLPRRRIYANNNYCI